MVGISCQSRSYRNDSSSRGQCGRHGGLGLADFYNVRATYRQARGMLQPALKIDTTFYKIPGGPGPNPAMIDSGKGRIQLLNVGKNPLVLLDVTCLAKPFARPVVMEQMGWLDEQILYAGSEDGITVPFDFSNKVPEETSRKVGYGFEFQVVASDLSRQISMTYVVHPVERRTTHHLGVPWRVKRKYATLGFRSRFYHLREKVLLNLGGRAKPANEGRVKTGQRGMHSGH